MSDIDSELDLDLQHLDLDKLPGSARIVFEQLLHPHDSGDDGADLRGAVDAHLEELERDAVEHEFLEVEAARALRLASYVLLAHAEQLDVDDAVRLARAAVRYFISDDDADDDRGVGGLDDDIAVMRTAAEAIGCQQALQHLAKFDV